MVLKMDKRNDGLSPPCNCKPTNVNQLSFAKGPDYTNVGYGLEGQILRPSKVYSLTSNVPNVFNEAPPKFVVTWTNSKDRANPMIQRSPKKRQDKVRL